MNFNNIPELVIGDLRADKALIQGGMGVGVSLSGLASAVADAGGIGVLASVEMGSIGQKREQSSKKENIEAVRSEIRKARKLTKGVLGINIMAALTQFDEMIETAIEEKIDIIFMGAGLPVKFSEPVTDVLKNVKKMLYKICCNCIFFQGCQNNIQLLEKIIQPCSRPGCC